MRILVAAVLTVLSVQTASAERRENKPFTTVNGRTSTAAPAGPRVFTLNTPGGGAAANGPAAAQAPAVTAGMIAGAPSDGGRAFIGGGRQTASRSATGRGVRRGGKAFWGGRKVDGDGGGAGGTTTTSTEEAPPNYSKPGALIRTTGQLPKYEKAETATTHTTDAGEIVMNNRKAFNVGQAPSVQQGPKDTLPPPNPDTFTRTTTGTGGAAANSGGSTGSGGTGGGHENGGGHDNNGSGNNDKDKSGDDYDSHGGDKAMASSFNDAF